MKILQLVKKYLAILGLKSHDAFQSHSINIESVMCFTVLGMCIISNFVYLIREANSFFEYVQSLYLFFASSITNTVFAYLTWKMTELFELIDNLEATVQHSEQKYFEYSMKVKRLN